MSQYLSPSSSLAVNQRFYIGPDATLWDLQDLSQPMMSQTPFERQNNQIILDNAHGRVLIAGLGIGLILLPIQMKPEVTSVLVVEKYQEVIDLIVPKIPIDPLKVTVVRGDIFNYLPLPQVFFDTIWVDIWTTAEEVNQIQAQNGSASRQAVVQGLSQFLLPGGFAKHFSGGIDFGAIENLQIQGGRVPPPIQNPKDPDPNPSSTGGIK